MASISMKVSIKRAWWVMPYLHAMIWLWRITGHGPDPQHVVRTVCRGYRVDVD